jgi:hypothetical protein
MSTKQPNALGTGPVVMPDEADAQGGGVVDSQYLEPDSAVLTLELADLLRDSNGEVVLFNDSHLPALAVRADSQLVASGEVEQHVTLAGDDVTGYRYVAFDNGTTLYYQQSLDLVILDGHDAVHS